LVFCSFEFGPHFFGWIENESVVNENQIRVKHALGRGAHESVAALFQRQNVGVLLDLFWG
jgi:hypothetical protein